MKNSTIAIGIACGIAATAWLAFHGDETQEARAEGEAPRIEKKRSGGTRWLPWQTGPKVEIAPEVSSADAKYEGPWVEMPVQVVDLEGRPVAGANVEIRAWVEDWATAGMSDEAYDAWVESQPERDEEYEDYEEGKMEPVATGRTDRKGTFRARVKPDIEVAFFAREGAREGASPVVYPMHPEDMVEGDEVPIVVVEIGETSILSGTVQDESGRPIADAWIDVWPLDPESDGEDMSELAINDVPAADGFVTDENGRFRIKFRAWGAFEVSFEADGRRRHTESVVQLLPGRETDLHITLETTAELAGVVLDERGEPVANASVAAIDEDGSSAATALTDETGAFRVDVASRGARFHVTAQGFRMAIAPVVDGAAITLSRGGSLAVSIAVSRELLESSGSTAVVFIASPDGDVPMATGEAERAPYLVVNRSERFLQNVSLDENGQGTFTVTGLPPGRFRVTVQVGGTIVVQHGITIHDGGETALVARIPDGNSAALAGQVTAPRTIFGGSLYLSSPGSMGIHTQVNPGGTFRFDAVPAGEWTLGGSIELEGAIGAAQPLRGDPGAKPRETMFHIDPIVVQLGYAERRTLQITASEALVEPVAHGGDGDFVEEEEIDSEDELFMPDVSIEELDAGLVVMRAGGTGRRLFGGDKITSIDGTEVASVESWEALELLYGEEGTTCRIAAVRPATGESFSVSLPRTRSISGDYH